MTDRQIEETTLGRKGRLLLVILGAALLAIACPAVNSPPQILSLVASPDAVAPGATSTITCLATDPEGTEVTYSWAVDGWTVPGSDYRLKWDAPEEEGTYVITVTVRDARGKKVEEGCDVLVSTLAAATPTPTGTPQPTPPLAYLNCTAARDSTQAAIDAYYAAYGQWPTADGEPGDIDWWELYPEFIEAMPSNDNSCEWWVDDNPLGSVCVLHHC